MEPLFEMPWQQAKERVIAMYPEYINFQTMKLIIEQGQRDGLWK